MVRWWPPTRGDGSRLSSRSRETVNGRSTAKRRPRRQWLVRNGRGKGKEQNPSTGFTGNWWNHGESRRRFRGTSKLRSVAFRSISGGKDGMDTLLVSQASNLYQPWPERWPEMGEPAGSCSQVGLDPVRFLFSLSSLLSFLSLSLSLSLSLNLYGWSTGSKSGVGYYIEPVTI